MTSHVRYVRDGDIATITMDDGRANALSPAMQAEVNEALEMAEHDDSKAVVLAGSSKLFCAGFDLAVVAANDRARTLAMVTGGFELVIRLLTFPKPVVIAATGPAIAMGSLLLLAGDHRVGSGRTWCQANEVAIGMTFPTSAIELMRMRLTPSALHSGSAMAATFIGDAAIAAGWLDELVDDGQVVSRAQEIAAMVVATLDIHAHTITKKRLRARTVTAIRDGLADIDHEFLGHQ